MNLLRSLSVMISLLLLSVSWLFLIDVFTPPQMSTFLVLVSISIILLMLSTLGMNIYHRITVKKSTTSTL